VVRIALLLWALWYGLEAAMWHFTATFLLPCCGDLWSDHPEDLSIFSVLSRDVLVLEHDVYVPHGHLDKSEACAVRNSPLLLALWRGPEAAMRHFAATFLPPYCDLLIRRI